MNLAPRLTAIFMMQWCAETLASSSTSVIPISDIEQFIETGIVPPEENSTFPISLSSTLLLVAEPLETVLNTAEVTSFQIDLRNFYDIIFDSQTKYNLTVRMVDVLNQILKQDEKMLEMETRVDVNFRPNPADQTLTQEDFHNIILNLVNKFESVLIQHLKKSESSLKEIQSIEAQNLEQSTGSSSLPIGLYVMIGIMGFIVVTTLVACFILYRKGWSRIPKYVFGGGNNDLQLRDDVDFPSKDSIMQGDDEENGIALKSKRFSFRPGYKIPQSPVPSIDESPEISRQDGFDRGSLTLTLETVNSSETVLGSRIELWAPAGKLGVAIDVVEGRPIVWRIKPGSPLEGFLDRGDIIVAIDEIDTSHMSAADVTSIMVRRMRQRRKIVFIRPN